MATRYWTVLTALALTTWPSGGLPAGRTAAAPAPSVRAPTALASAGKARAPHEVEIVGVDYAFRLPRELPAGRTIFRFVNQGKVRHELNIVLLARGVSIEEFMAATGASQADRARKAQLVEATVGVLMADPGQRAPGMLATELLPGRTYAVHCIFRDSPTGPSHESMGMYSAIRVNRAQAAASRAVPADTIVATDYLFQRYTHTLPPGPHEFAFANVGRQRHEVLLALLARGATRQQVLDSARADRDPGRLLDGIVGVLHTPAGKAPVGTLRVDLLPGREYILLCTFRDSDTSPQHLSMGMSGSIQVGPSAR